MFKLVNDCPNISGRIAWHAKEPTHFELMYASEAKTRVHQTSGFEVPIFDVCGTIMNAGFSIRTKKMINT